MGKDIKNKAKGQISRYLFWPIYFDVFWVVVTLAAYAFSFRAGVLMTVSAIIYIAATIVIYIKFKPTIMRRLVDFGAEYSQVQRQMLHEMEIPYGLIDENGKVLWTNTELDKLFNGKSIRNKSVISVFKGFESEYLEFEEDGRNEFQIQFEEHEYKIVLKIFTLKDSLSENQMQLLEENSGSLISMYMFDETKISQLTKENREERLVTGHIYIDNYDEVLQSIEVTRRTLLVALIDRRINKYFAQYDGIVRKLENDKYFVIFKTKYISKMQTNKFSILDEVKTVNIGNGLPITISIGIGMGGAELVENYELAGLANRYGTWQRRRSGSR